MANVSDQFIRDYKKKKILLPGAHLGTFKKFEKHSLSLHSFFCKLSLRRRVKASLVWHPLDIPSLSSLRREFSGRSSESLSELSSSDAPSNYRQKLILLEITILFGQYIS